MTNCYMNPFSRPQMRAAAGFDSDWAGSYFISRFLNKPAAELRRQVFPQLDAWQAVHIGPTLTTRGAQPNKAAYGFLQLLDWLRDVLLQDAPFLQAAFPDHPIWLDPLFSRASYLAWSRHLQRATEGAEIDNHMFTIQKAHPAIASKLGTIQSSQAAHTGQLAGLQAELTELRDSIGLVLHELKIQGAQRALPWVMLPPGSELYQHLQPGGAAVNGATGATATGATGATATATAIATAARAGNPPAAGPLQLQNSGEDQPPTWPVPRHPKTVAELLKIWQFGLGEMPPIKELEDRWGSRWRPVKDRQFFSTRYYIIRQVYHLSAATGRLLEDVARDLDRQKGSASLNKVFDLLKSREHNGTATY
jgi:hypothetical protein